MKTLLNRTFRSIGRSIKNVLRPIAKKVRGPLTKLLSPPEFEAAIRNLEQLTHNLQGYVDQSDQLILAMFRSMRAPNGSAAIATNFAAVSLGNQRILTAHPVATFMFVDGNNVRETPQILFNRFQPGVCKTLQQLAKPGGTYVDLGAGQGFHTLTLAVKAGHSGYVFSIEPNSAAAEFLSDNLVATGLKNTMVFPQSRDTTTAMTWLKEQLAAKRLRPDLIHVGASMKDVPILDGLREWIAEEPAGEMRPTCNTKILLSLPLGNALADALREAGYKFWIVEAVGALFRTCWEEMDERSRREELHVLAARRLDD
jgi:predicted O-methyltransferase YrrM